MQLTDEIIMAYVDGELSEEESTEVRNSIIKNKDAMRKMEGYSKSRDYLLDEFQHIREAPVPKELEDIVRNHPSVIRPDLYLVLLITRLKAVLASRTYNLSYPALAASFVLGISLSLMLSDQFLSEVTLGLGGDQSGQIRNANTLKQQLSVLLSRAIEDSPSASTYTLKLNQETIPIIVLSETTNPEGERCKVLQLGKTSQADLNQTVLLTCLDQDKEWYIQF